MKTIEDIEQKEMKLKQQFAPSIKKHLIKLFDDSQPRVGINFREPYTEDFEDDYNSELINWITDAAESIGASIDTLPSLTTITWPKYIDIGETMYEIEVNHTGMFVPVEAGQIGIYMAKLYDLILDVMWMTRGHDVKLKDSAGREYQNRVTDF